MLEVGNKAPNFKLEKTGGGTISLEDCLGKNAVIYFYPKDLTPGCTKQAIALTENIEEFTKRDTIIIGISPDGMSSHDKFVKKHNLKIILAADEDKQTIESYGVWKEKKMFGRTYMGVERTTFLVDRTGTIKAIWNKVKVQSHVKSLLEELDR